MHRQQQANSHSQPTARVANQNRRRRDVVPLDTAPRSGTKPTESGSSHRAQSTARNSSLPPIRRRLLERPAKRLRSGTVAYNELEDDEPDRQPITDPVPLSDDSDDEYQNPDIFDETELDTEPDTEEDDIADGTTSRHQSRAGEKRSHNRVSTVRISTTYGSQEAALVRRTLSARGHIIRSGAYAPPANSSSNLSQYPSPLATHSATTSGVSSSTPSGDRSPPRHGHIWPDINSRRNTATGAEGAVVVAAKALILRYTLFDEPLPGPVVLTAQVHQVWLQALNQISRAGNIEASEESVKLVS